MSKSPSVCMETKEQFQMPGFVGGKARQAAHEEWMRRCCRGGFAIHDDEPVPIQPMFSWEEVGTLAATAAEDIVTVIVWCGWMAKDGWFQQEKKR